MKPNVNLKNVEIPILRGMVYKVTILFKNLYIYIFKRNRKDGFLYRNESLFVFVKICERIEISTILVLQVDKNG